MITKHPLKKISLGLLASFSLVQGAGAAVEPAPAAPVVAQLVGRIFEQTHYNHHPIDDTVSRQLLMQAIEAYDYNHMIFDKADIDDFQARYGATLDDRLREGDITPAYEIFEKYLQRLEERAALVKKLTAETFTFTADEALVVDRHDAAWPATPEESSDLWRKRVKYEVLQEKLGGTKAEEQAKTVNQRYERLLRSYKEYDSNDVLQSYLTSLAHTYDPHSDYMAAPQAENFNISMRLSLVGIGAVLRSEDGYAKIVSLVPGGPADTDKRLKPNDKIEAVAQGDGPFLEVVGMKLDRLVQLIRGEKGTTVRLRVIPTDAMDPATRTTIALVREEIKLTDQEAKAKIITTPALSGRGGRRIGVIDLPSFYADMKSAGEAKSTTRDVEKLITELRREGIDGLIIDLRRNGGGSLSEAVTLTGIFIPDGPVVQVKDTHGLIKSLRDTDPGMAYTGPLAVLTSRASASASEIFAGALQDYGRAVIIGEKSTFGKGTVQSVVELAQYLPGAMQSYKPGALKLTIQKFYRVSGGSTQNRGVIPDIRLPSLTDYMDVTETSLKNALPYDEVEQARFSRIDLVSRAMNQLQKASTERVNGSKEFAYVREDIERFKKQLADKSVSLNEKKRLDEKKTDEALTQSRKKERAARKAVKPDEVDITLASIDAGTAPLPVKPPEEKKPDEKAKADGKHGDPEDESYDKAPPAPDVYLEESVQVVSDLAGLTAVQGAAAGSPAPVLTP
ncbi:MAG: carboxy terminal-processing peptidase [Elusimicrobiota bacterium]